MFNMLDPVFYIYRFSKVNLDQGRILKILNRGVIIPRENEGI